MHFANRYNYNPLVQKGLMSGKQLFAFKNLLIRRDVRNEINVNAE